MYKGSAAAILNRGEISEERIMEYATGRKALNREGQ
jgi:hypothetical protein